VDGHAVLLRVATREIAARGCPVDVEVSVYLDTLYALPGLDDIIGIGELVIPLSDLARALLRAARIALCVDLGTRDLIHEGVSRVGIACKYCAVSVPVDLETVVYLYSVGEQVVCDDAFCRLGILLCNAGDIRSIRAIEALGLERSASAYDNLFAVASPVRHGCALAPGITLIEHEGLGKVILAAVNEYGHGIARTDSTCGTKSADSISRLDKGAEGSILTPVSADKARGYVENLFHCVLLSACHAYRRRLHRR